MELLRTVADGLLGLRVHLDDDAVGAGRGGDGIIVEVHPVPEEAICDGPQQLHTDGLDEYVARLEQAAAVAGKVLSSAPA